MLDLLTEGGGAFEPNPVKRAGGAIKIRAGEIRGSAGKASGHPFSQPLSH